LELGVKIIVWIRVRVRVRVGRMWYEESNARRENKRYEIKIQIGKAKNEKEMWVQQGHQEPHPNQWHIETKLPAIQGEQLEDDVAPVTAEYVPAKNER
jgi:hypothetical protein